MVAVTLGLAGCGTQPSADSQLPTCGELPPAFSADAGIKAQVYAPKSAASGSKVKVRIRLSTASPRRLIVHHNMMRIVRHGQVVGAYGGASTADLRLVQVGPNQPATVTQPVRLLGCPKDEKVDPAHPNASRSPLPAGRYALVAVIPLPRGKKRSIPVPSGKKRSTPLEHIHVTS